MDTCIAAARRGGCRQRLGRSWPLARSQPQQRAVRSHDRSVLGPVVLPALSLSLLRALLSAGRGGPAGDSAGLCGTGGRADGRTVAELLVLLQCFADLLSLRKRLSRW